MVVSFRFLFLSLASSSFCCCCCFRNPCKRNGFSVFLFLFPPPPPPNEKNNLTTPLRCEFLKPTAGAYLWALFIIRVFRTRIEFMCVLLNEVVQDEDMAFPSLSLSRSFTQCNWGRRRRFALYFTIIFASDLCASKWSRGGRRNNAVETPRMPQGMWLPEFTPRTTKFFSYKTDFCAWIMTCSFRRVRYLEIFLGKGRKRQQFFFRW